MQPGDECTAAGYLDALTVWVLIKTDLGIDEIERYGLPSERWGGEQIARNEDIYHTWHKPRRRRGSDPCHHPSS
jgi:hypothetical protein